MWLAACTVSAIQYPIQCHSNMCSRTCLLHPLKKKQHWKTLSCEKNCNQKASTWGLCERGHQDYRLLSPGKDRWLASPLPVTSWFIMAPKSKSPTFWEWQKWRHFHHQLLKTKSLTFWYIWNYLHPKKKITWNLKKIIFNRNLHFWIPCSFSRM